MATEVIIPALGVVVEKVKIITWLKSEGDQVKKGEPLIEVESDKVITEIVSPASGILGSVLYPEGSEVPITNVVALILVEGETIPDSYRRPPREILPGTAALASPVTLAAQEVRPLAKAVPAARKLAEAKGIDLSLVTPTGPHGTIMIKDVEACLAYQTSEKRPQKTSTLARKVAEEFRVSLRDVQGTGAGARIMKEDVLGILKQASPSGQGAAFSQQILPMSRMRQVIAARLSESAFTAPHIYLFSEVNMEAILHLRKTILEEFERRFGIRLSINDFFLKAVALAIRQFPLFNASIKGDEIHIHPEINVGLAVALDEGLIVPAIPQTDRLSLESIARQRTDLVERARKGRLILSEIERGTFTITSLSGFDVTFFTAIINPPQSGILSVGKIQDQLTLENGVVKTRKVVTVGLSADHRIIDGAVAARFLQTIKKMIESPVFYFTDVQV